MDFCKNRNEFISLYIDKMLDDSTKIEFEKHVAICAECANRLKEESMLTELCRESEEIELPAEFSTSLHEKLKGIKLKENENSRRPFIYNKKWIAGLSTAAVLLVSLMAYNLLPDMRGTKDSASMAMDSRVQESVTASSDSSSSPRSPQTDDPQLYQKENGTSGSAGASTESSGAGNSGAVQKFANATPSGGKAKGKYAENPVIGNAAPASDKNEEGNGKDSVYSLKMAQLSDFQQYFSNSAEMDLANTGDDSQNSEIEEFAKLMKELGGRELESDQDTAELTGPVYVEYIISLDAFERIQKEAMDKYNLQINEKTPVKQQEITDEYNELNRQKNELDKKIDEAAKKSEDTSSMEEERDNLSQKMSEIVKNSGMITVRIYFVDK